MMQAKKKMSMMMRACTLFGTFVALGGCASDMTPEDEPGESEDAVIGGSDSPASDNNVVYIARKNADGQWVHGGTGTIIGPHHVLTARHVTCKHAAGNTPNVITYSCSQNYVAGDMGIFIGEKKTAAFSSAPTLKAVQVLRYDNAPQFVFSGTQTEDVAILRFSETLVGAKALNGTPIYPTIVKDNEKPSVGDKVKLVGWGKVDAAGTPASVRKFKNVSVMGVTLGGSDLAHEKAVLNPAAGQCPGDSGGPYFMQNGKLVAVVSTGASCGSASNRATLLSGRVGRWVRKQL